MADKPLTVEQAIEFLQGFIGEAGIMVTSLVVSVEVSADDLPVDEPEMFENNQSKSNAPGR